MTAKDVESLGWLAVTGVGIYVAYQAYKTFINNGQPPVDNTDYQGYGLIGAAGAAANTATGGILDKLGNWIGGAIYQDVYPENSS